MVRVLIGLTSGREIRMDLDLHDAWHLVNWLNVGKAIVHTVGSTHLVRHHITYITTWEVPLGPDS